MNSIEIDREIERRRQKGWVVAGVWTFALRDVLRLTYGGLWHNESKSWFMPSRESWLAALALQPDEEEEPPPQKLQSPKPKPPKKVKKAPMPTPSTSPYRVQERVQAMTRAANATLEALDHWWDEELDEEGREAVTRYVLSRQQRSDPPADQAPVVQAVQVVDRQEYQEDHQEERAAQWYSLPERIRKYHYDKYCRSVVEKGQEPVSEDRYARGLIAGWIVQGRNCGDDH